MCCKMLEILELESILVLINYWLTLHSYNTEIRPVKFPRISQTL